MMTWDFEKDDKQAKRILRLLEVWIIKNYGERCNDKILHCVICKVWNAFDNLKANLWV